jgi:hypothetical protein
MLGAVCKSCEVLDVRQTGLGEAINNLDIK